MNDHIAQPSSRRHRASCLIYLLVISCLVLAESTARAQTQKPASTSPVSEFSGKVVEAMNAAGYTYALVDTGASKLWAAAPQFPVKVGDSLAVAQAMPMPNYHSKTLNRDFDVVYFTGNVKVNGVSPDAGGKSAELPKNHPHITGVLDKPVVDLSGIKKAEDGKSIAEIYADKSKISGKPVKVRGRVVKYNGDIMGRNWIHIRDGTGRAGSDDLTVTTASKAKVGDMVLVTGTAATDRDFGASYQYSLIIENAQVTVE
jgi:hypothetical protein